MKVFRLTSVSCGLFRARGSGGHARRVTSCGFHEELKCVDMANWLAQKSGSNYMITDAGNPTDVKTFSSREEFDTYIVENSPFTSRIFATLHKQLDAGEVVPLNWADTDSVFLPHC
jgi:hypothetical protein